MGTISRGFGSMENNQNQKKEKLNKAERQLKIGKKRENLTVSIIQCNKLLNSMQKQLADCYKQCNSICQGFQSQPELTTRCNMILRLLVSCTKMLGQQKMQLWMINEDAIGREVDAEQ